MSAGSTRGDRGAPGPPPLGASAAVRGELHQPTRPPQRPRSHRALAKTLGSGGAEPPARGRAQPGRCETPLSASLSPPQLPPFPPG